MSASPDILDIVYCQFPTDEGGSLPHYALVTGIQKGINGHVMAQIVYATSKKIDVNANKDHKGIDFVVTPTNFGSKFWDKTGLKLKHGMVGTRFQCNRTAMMEISELEVVGRIDTDISPAAFNALRKAMMNAN